MLTLTEAAIAQVRRAREAEPRFRGKALRVNVDRGGCSGYSYAFAFDEKSAFDAEAAYGDVRVICDPESLRLLEGCVVTYEQAGLAAGAFRIENPNATGHCGCGLSFSA